MKELTDPKNTLFQRMIKENNALTVPTLELDSPHLAKYISSMFQKTVLPELFQKFETNLPDWPITKTLRNKVNLVKSTKKRKQESDEEEKEIEKSLIDDELKIKQCRFAYSLLNLEKTGLFHIATSGNNINGSVITRQMFQWTKDDINQ